MKEITSLSLIPKSGMQILYFTATWCGPCRVLRPIMEQVSKEIQNDVEIIKIDVDQGQDVSNHYGIRGIPAVVVLKNGEEIVRKVGGLSESTIKNLIAEAQF